jgi:hypothetical protein
VREIVGAPFWVILAGCLGWSAIVRADAGAASGLFQALTGRGLSAISPLEDWGVSLGGWASVGITYNHHDPGDHRNGPVTFNDRASEFQLNQLYLFMERAVNKEAKRWDIGGRVDLLWGSDSRFAQAVGHWDDDLVNPADFRFYRLAIPQAYAEIATPWARGATLKLGHFYTILGQEVVQAPGNFFYSHSYAMQYGEPFTHTGALLSHPVTDNLTALAGAVIGPYRNGDNVGKHPENWNFLGGLTWASEDGATSLSAALTSGDDFDTGNRTIASLVISHQLSEKLQAILQGDHGSQTRGRQMEDAHWYGLNQYLLYNLTDTVTLGLRGEWFRDDSGVRVAPVAASYYELTSGVGWKPQPWLLLRLEGRNDWADARQRVFGADRQNYQFTLGANATVSF